MKRFIKTSFFTKKKGVVLLALTFSLLSPAAVLARPPQWNFGASPTAQTVHIDEGHAGRAGATTGSNGARHIANQTSPYAEGEFIGTLHVERLGRTVRIYEGETMSNMDKGAGRFPFSGLNSGNMSLVGHNRGRTNGFFSFVRLLQYGDIITVETNHGIRRFAVEMVYTISETDFGPLQEFGDNRLTLITCVEYQPTQRRIAMALQID